MRLRFSKMHGLGNDFVVFDAVNQDVVLGTEQVRHLAQRRLGVGCDQVLLVERPRSPEVDFHYRIFNADGSEVGQCGNGARCIARFVRDQGLSDKDQIRVATSAGVIALRIEPDGGVTADMGAPRFAPEQIPFDAPRQAAHYPLQVGDRSYRIGAVSMGNPHAVLQVGDVAQAPVAALGPQIESHPRFAQRTNVGFMEVQGRDRIRLRVYERGAGETQACGTAACAAVAVGRLWDLLDERVAVCLPGGELQIRWQGGDAPVWMTGPAVHVFEGQIEL